MPFTPLRSHNAELGHMRPQALIAWVRCRINGKAKDMSTAALLTSGTGKPMESLEPSHKEVVPAIAEGHGQSE
jgi:hypothetical protein